MKPISGYSKEFPLFVQNNGMKCYTDFSIIELVKWKWQWEMSWDVILLDQVTTPLGAICQKSNQINDICN